MAKKIFTDESLSSLISEIKKYVLSVVSKKSDVDHSHNDTYYTETEIDSKLSKKPDNVYLTQAEYDALGDEKYTNGIKYYITDNGLEQDADTIEYDNSTSGMNASNIQNAIDELYQITTKNEMAEKSGLSGWLRSFEFDRNKKICFIGDSTTDGLAGSAQFLYECLNRYYVNSGDNLEGVTLVDKGANGNTCYNFIDNKPSGKGINDCIAEQADLYVFCYGINDVRTGNTTKEQLKSYISTAVERLLNETNGYILLRVPNSLLADDPTGSNSVQPLSNAQLYTDMMWEAYMELKHKWARVDVLDTQTLIFGRAVLDGANNPYMTDQLHPNRDGFYRIARCIADYIGITPKLRTDLVELAKTSNPDKPYMVYPKILETNDYELVCHGYFIGMGSNYLDFAMDPSQAYKIMLGDIVKVGDKLVYELPDGFQAVAQHVNTRFRNMTFDGYENHNQGMVKIYRKKYAIMNNYAVYTKTLENNTTLDYFTLPNMRIKSIVCNLAKPVIAPLNFKLKQIRHTAITDIADISFAINNMTAVITFDPTTCPDGYYDTSHENKYGALFYIESGENTYTGEIIMNLTVYG